MDKYLKMQKSDIPKKIHQVWIGDSQPPIIWCHSWRKRYRQHYPGWESKLCTDREVAAQMSLRHRADAKCADAVCQCRRQRVTACSLQACHRGGCQQSTVHQARPGTCDQGRWLHAVSQRTRSKMRGGEAGALWEGVRESSGLPCARAVLCIYPLNAGALRGQT